MKNDPNKIQKISLDIIDEPASPVRSRFSDSAFNNLIRSIRSVGVLQPILVRKNGRRYEVIAGHRRLRASHLAGLVSIPAIVCDVSSDDSDVIKLHENLNREDVCIGDEAIFIRSFMHKHNLSSTLMGEKLGRSDKYVLDRLDFLTFPGELKMAVDDGKVSFSAAKYLAKISDRKIRDEYIHFAISGGITTRMAKQWLDESKRGTLAPRVEEQIQKDEETGKTQIVPFIKCQLCGGDIEVGGQKVIFTHPECIEEFQRIAAGGQPTPPPS